MKQIKNNFLSGHPINAQLLSLIPKEIFSEVVEQENSDRYYKKLKPGFCIRLHYSLSRFLSGRVKIARKSGCLETESAAADMVKSKTAAKRLILKQF